MAKNLHKEIEFLETKNVALRKVADEHQAELEKLKKMAANPAPRVRRNLKRLRIEKIAVNYMTRWHIKPGKKKAAATTTA